MLMPSVFGENLFDNFFDGFGFHDFTNDVDQTLYGKNAKHLMSTDVKEKDGTYEVAMDLPGFKKEDIKMQLKDGYLTISAAKGLEKNEKNEDGKYVRRERYSGNMSRTFFVGENVKEEEIQPKYENGILSFSVPKEQKQAVEEKEHYIEIA